MDGAAMEQITAWLERAAAVVAVVLGAWFGLGLVACVIARAAPRLRSAQQAARWSPALLRRIAGVACTTSFLFTPQVTPAAVAAERVADEPVVRAPQAWVPAVEVPPPPPPAPAPAPPVASEYVVQPGDNLWVIARTTLGARPDSPSDSEVARYWSKLIDANRASLRSGDPSLIYPGEIITLPPPEN